MSFRWRHFFDNRLVAWKRTLRTADYKSERSIDIHTDHRLLVTRENSQWRGVVACGEITNMWFTELNREKAPESSLNSCHENIFQHLLKEPSNNDSTQSLFSFAKCFITEKYCIRRKKRTKRKIFASIVIYRVTPRFFFFSLRQKRESVSSFFWFSLAFIYFV